MLKRRILPILLLTLGLWLLSGCFILPTPEKPSINNVNDRDFRHLVGDAASGSPIHPNTPRLDIVRLLGRPAWETPDHTAVAYEFATERSVWVIPLCFSTECASKREYVLYIEYDPEDRLHRWEMVHKDIRYDWFQGVAQSGIDHVVNRLNSKLRSVPRPATIESGT